MDFHQPVQGYPRRVGVWHRLHARRRAKDCLQSNAALLHRVADELLEREQIDGDELLAMIAEARIPLYLSRDAPGVAVPYREAAGAAA